MIKSYWNNLDVKQRYIVAFGAAFVCVALLLEFAVIPLWDARAKMKKSIAANAKKYEEVIKLDAEFALQDAKIAQIKQTMASRPADFTLFSHLEKKAQAAQVKGSIRQMNSVPGLRSATFEEALVDMKLDKLTIKQLTDFLYQVESPSEMIKIKRITVGKMKESPEYVSAQLLVVSYTPVAPRPGGS
jgi:type II secretory pathway component PulM